DSPQLDYAKSPAREPDRLSGGAFIGIFGCESGSADLHSQTVFEVAEDLLDEAVHFLRRERLILRNKVQGEGHALFALAQLVAAVDVEEFDFPYPRAGLAHFLDNIAAGDFLVGHESQ